MRKKEIRKGKKILLSDEEYFGELEKHWPTSIVDSCKKAWRWYWKAIQEIWRGKGHDPHLLKRHLGVIRCAYVYGYFDGTTKMLKEIYGLAKNVIKEREKEKIMKYVI